MAQARTTTTQRHDDDAATADDNDDYDDDDDRDNDDDDDVPLGSIVFRPHTYPVILWEVRDSITMRSFTAYNVAACAISESTIDYYHDVPGGKPMKVTLAAICNIDAA